MSELVDATEIEQIVGAKRHNVQHLARAVDDEETVYILHSQRCKDDRPDLRDCLYSRALDNGIDVPFWREQGCMDRVVALGIYHDRLLPITPPWLDETATS